MKSHDSVEVSLAEISAQKPEYDIGTSFQLNLGSSKNGIMILCIFYHFYQSNITS